MRKIYNYYFDGMGEMSKLKADYMHYALDKALSLMGGFQQPDHYDREYSEEELKKINDYDTKLQIEMQDYIKDIICGLVGSEFGLIKLDNAPKYGEINDNFRAMKEEVDIHLAKEQARALKRKRLEDLKREMNDN